MSSISRSQFLRGDWRGDKPELLPPWAIPEPGFSNTCDGCGDCVSACSEKIITISPRKRPQLDFSQRGCTFCGDCADVCNPGALLRTLPLPRQLEAVINDSCLSKRGISCVRCIEECEHDAIVTQPALGGRIDLFIDQNLCTGCGSCVAVCPVSAVFMKKRLK